MSSARARLLRFAAVALAVGVGLHLLRSARRRVPCEPSPPEPDRLDRRGIGALAAILVLIILAGTVTPLSIHARHASARQQWAIAATGGNPARAPELMVRNGCAGCHIIAGVPGAVGRTGPELAGLAHQKFIAGTLPNTPENLIAWIRDARRFNPRTAMPSTLVGEEDARDIAAYLYTIRR